MLKTLVNYGLRLLGAFTLVVALSPSAVADMTVVGGHESNGSPLTACYAGYNNGFHPGKVVGQSCAIGWGGQEINIVTFVRGCHQNGCYDFLWIPDYLRPIYMKPDAGTYNNGYQTPKQFENGQPRYYCQVDFQGGLHAGKVVGASNETPSGLQNSTCNFGYGGKEYYISYPNYRILRLIGGTS